MNFVDETESKKVLAEWFRLTEAWQQAEKDLAQAQQDATAGLPEGEANVAKARSELLYLKAQMNEVIASGMKARDKDVSDFVAGTIQFGKLN